MTCDEFERVLPELEGDHTLELDAHLRSCAACADLLTPAGLIVFSTNAQKFRLDETLAQRFEVRDVSAVTLPKDFERTPRIHKCYEVQERT